ncbi:tryptophan--tRNA ligase [Candidatus Giovannonibacteria bacterium RIFCSPLOWO2_01_FULL_43_160]|uniref:Tryptophan--tRNA ligase n=2 Tax=Candidatus Giovannoniibacteriota TaxID=1752738 RepID=A0A0G1IVQ2_9BACT|nr:MAG: Tryptophan-tRNA ligase [Candidatus Giovannonibacteria bacterium GW2011_GWB1_43_13]KKS99257.1 MAG: Tryptophan-tRNA ligase [Candidatus Giovannonibacteria bacterium GW2011_GWA1_43_15]KKT63140.1 MAG: Tryptophan-tRNA ligase [Candidatus Giovannonibacteria bacterium GW2011_GWA2_44_26]OGF58200.1 MAG: tryptophan--tRNA ligase [Candidatus Giovannonibacteria bacterium RIFCSPHIGHO2_01_FULL_43_140]OGF70291.1 MAG: tryptophan--tRNA ligase [Candidatus Giovannonibacteria bacterium RIFCSPHIGHO2_02_FULL_44
MAKEVIVSAIQASGNVHIGNYIGAIQQFVKLQDKYQGYFFIADLHALTEPQDPEKLRKQILDSAALYMACGLDPKEAVIFIQSQVPEHTELGWILNTITPLGELERMTQFKDKSKKRKNILAGLLNYPTLMAADILLYDADLVPVGKDQSQHLEFTRTVARKFNSKFGVTFKEPRALLKKEGALIMGLDNPSNKMAKSAQSPNNYIAILDEPNEIQRKIKIAVTDSGKEIKYDPVKKPAISNLLIIYSAMSGKSIKNLESKFKEKTYAEFKSSLADLLVEKLSPIQKEYKRLIENKGELLKVLNNGKEQAQKVARTTMLDVRKKIGLLCE